MNNIKEKAKEIFMKSSLELQPFNQETLFDVMIEFAREMCELQKQECVESARIKEFHLHNLYYNDDTNHLSRHCFGLDIKSILNCENVCSK